MIESVWVFDRAWLLVLAVVLPIAFAFLFGIYFRRRAARLARLGDRTLVGRLMPPAAFRRSRWRPIRLAGCAAFAAIALAGPRWGTGEPIASRTDGFDLVLALDASLSMLATDVRPSRLELMRQEVRRLMALSPSDRVGLLAWAGRSYILTPMTMDVGALELYLDNLDPSVVGQPGTSLARTIRQGVSLLQLANSDAGRALVVFTDGEAFDPIEDIQAAGVEAKAAGVTLITVGFGTRAGSTIPLREGAEETLKRDAEGNIVVTRYEPTPLRTAAEAAGGVFIDAGATDKANRIRRALATLRTSRSAAGAAQERRQRFQLFVIPALVLLILDTFLSERRGRGQVAPASATTAEPRSAPPIDAATTSVAAPGVTRAADLARQGASTRT